MMYSRRGHTLCFLLFLLVMAGLSEAGASVKRQKQQEQSQIYYRQMHDDTIIMTPWRFRENAPKSEAFYDTLKTKHYRNPITRFLARSLVRTRRLSDEEAPILNFRMNRNYFENYAGKRINSIHIIQADIFATPDTSIRVSWAERLADNIHILTRRKQVVQNLLFQVGDTLNPYILSINEELFRRQPYFSTAYLIVLDDPQDPEGVQVHLFARDNWSIGGDIKLTGARRKVSVYDRNFLGFGDELRFTYTSDDVLHNPGFEVSYLIRNLLGSFTDVTTRVGMGSGQNTAQIEAEKPFILPADHGWGLTVGHVFDKEKQRLVDTSLNIDRFTLLAWYGKSWCLDWDIGTSVYTAAGYHEERYLTRPEIGDRENPFYHNSRTILGSVGFARRNYFQGNMIYGFGLTEDIPYGFRTELIGGIQWGERLSRRYYLGAQGYWGNLIGDHYMEAGLKLGTFFNHGKLQQSTVGAHVRHFTPLMRIGAQHFLRQFSNLSAVMGFHRLEGEQEALRYERDIGIRGLRTNGWAHGYNRLIVSSETVLFTPMYLYHFRFAFFLFGDAGWLGNDNRLLKNRFTGAVGLGVRLKNERLIFNNIQIRLGIAFNRPEEIKYGNFSVATEKEYPDANFIPGRPQIIEYR